MIESTVAVMVPESRSQGSGVIVNEEGYILTAAHVIGRRGLPAIITFPDGRRVRAETLGADHESDAGMLRIVEKGKWAYSPMAEADSTQLGDWCIATGHPGGWQSKRPPVIRIGRVNTVRDSMVRTDATLVGGDSGGPLFNLKGEVIGINSRIGVSTAWNLHVPVGVYENGWKNLSSPAGFLGVGGDLNDRAGPCRLTSVRQGTPAAKAGIREGDVIKKFDGKRIDNFEDLVVTVSQYPPDTPVKVEVQRGNKTLVFEVTLARKDVYSR
jgi:serine protease Do